MEVNTCLEGAKVHTLLGPLLLLLLLLQNPLPPQALPLFVCSAMAVPLGLCL